MKAAAVAKLGERNILQEQGTGFEQALAVDVLVDAVAGSVLEAAHEVVAAEVADGGQLVDGQVFRQVVVDVLDDRLNLIVIDDEVQRVNFPVDQGAVEQDHEFDEQHFDVKVVGEALLVGHLLEFFHMEKQILAFAGRKVHDAGVTRRRHEAGRKVIAVTGVAVEEFRRYIDDDAFVGNPRGRQGPMDLTGPDKDDVMGLERIGLPLNAIVGFAIEEKDDFMEFVVMEGNLFQNAVFQAKNLEGIEEIAFFFIFNHGVTSYFSIIALFAM